MMERIADVRDSGLEWQQVKGRGMAFELQAGAGVAATLRFSGNPGRSAQGHCRDGSWDFQRGRFWERNATVRASDSGVEVALIKHKTWSGGATLEFTSGLIVNAGTNFWHTGVELQTVEGESLLRQKLAGMLRLAGSVEVAPVAADMTELPLLVVGGWYMAVMSYMDASAASAVAVVG